MLLLLARLCAAQTITDCYFAALDEALSAATSSIYSADLTPLHGPPPLLWNHRTTDQLLNGGTYDVLSALLSPGPIEGTVTLGEPGSFTAAHTALLQSLTFVRSEADESRLLDATRQLDERGEALLSAYSARFPPPADLDDLLVVIGREWSDTPQTLEDLVAAPRLREALPLAPPSAEPVLVALSRYLDTLRTVRTFTDRAEQASADRARALDNALSPALSDGGVVTIDPFTQQTLPPRPGYTVPLSVADIAHDLQDPDREITLQLRLSRAAGKMSCRAEEGEAGILALSVTWRGFSLVPLQAEPFQSATGTGWLLTAPIKEAFAGRPPTATGHRFLMPPPLTPAQFRRPAAVLIANPPTVTLALGESLPEELSSILDLDEPGALVRSAPSSGPVAILQQSAHMLGVVIERPGQP